MTPEELKQAMEGLLVARVEIIRYANGGEWENNKDGWEDDPEVGHGDADDLMVKTLRDLGYGEAMDIYESQTRWCA